MFHIRLANSTEWPQLQQLNNEVFIESAQYDDDLISNWALTAEGEQYFRELVVDPKSVCLVAENEKHELVGYIAGTPKVIDYRKSKYFEIENVGVLPNYRSQGIGQKLIAQLSNWAKEHGYQKIFVNAYAQNSKAIRFYKKSGFSEIDVSLEKSI